MLFILEHLQIHQWSQNQDDMISSPNFFINASSCQASSEAQRANEHTKFIEIGEIGLTKLPNAVTSYCTFNFKEIRNKKVHFTSIQNIHQSLS